MRGESGLPWGDFFWHGCAGGVACRRHAPNRCAACQGPVLHTSQGSAAGVHFKRTSEVGRVCTGEWVGLCVRSRCCVEVGCKQGLCLCWKHFCQRVCSTSQALSVVSGTSCVVRQFIVSAVVVAGCSFKEIRLGKRKIIELDNGPSDDDAIAIPLGDGCDNPLYSRSRTGIVIC